MSRGFAASIYLMLTVPALILAGFTGAIWWMYRKSRGPAGAGARSPG